MNRKLNISLTELDRHCTIKIFSPYCTSLNLCLLLVDCHRWINFHV
jgi:hypothetical protein